MRLSCEDFGQWVSWNHMLIKRICVQMWFRPSSEHGDVCRCVNENGYGEELYDAQSFTQLLEKHFAPH